MKLDLQSLSLDAKPFPFKDEAVLQIRPFPRIKQGTKYNPADGSLTMSGEAQYERFAYCLTGWEGVADENGQPIVLKDAVKKAIYDANWEGIADFVLIKSMQFDRQKEEAEKN